MTTGLGVVIVTYNSQSAIGGLLRALPAALGECGDTAVVVVDNGSSDETLDVVEQHREVRVVANGQNLGYAAACNIGMRSLPPEWDVVVLNADVRPEPGSVAILRSALARPGVGIAVPHLTDPDGSTSFSRRRTPTIRRALGEAVVGRRSRRWAFASEVVTNRDAYADPGRTAWATGAAMAISAACRRAIGDLDERFFLYSEETEYCLRARDHGMTVWYEPSASMMHIGGAAHENPALYALLTSNRVRLHRMRHTRAAAGMFWLVVLLGETLRLPRHPRHRAAVAALLRLVVSGTDGAAPVPGSRTTHRSAGPAPLRAAS